MKLVQRLLQPATIARAADSGQAARAAGSGPVGRRIRQLIKYGTVSLISTVTSLSVLGLLVATDAMPAAWANVVATAVGTAPSFELNRRWVWGKTGKRSVWAEIGPFATMTFAGLGLSTLTVGLTAAWARRAGFDPTMRTIVAELANLAAFGSLWLVQFVILDRVLFKTADADADGPSSRALVSDERSLEAA